MIKRHTLQKSEFKELVTPIFKKYNLLDEVYVFGSYLTDKFNNQSDFDFIIDELNPSIIKNFGLSNLYIELKKALGRDVDLIDLNYIEDMEHDNFFKQEARRTRKKINEL